jgi:Ras-related C3 botulinum toxin substrate 1
MQKIHCYLLGDGGVGKTTLLIRYSTGSFPTIYIPAAIDPYSSNVMVDGESITFTLYDMFRRCDCEDRLRPYARPETNIILVCFSLADPYTFENVRSRWLPEILYYAPNVPFILVGTKLDLRQNPMTIEELQKYNETPISYIQGLQMEKELHAVNYLECSALTQNGLKEVFDEAIRVGLCYKRQKQRHPQCMLL